MHLTHRLLAVSLTACTALFVVAPNAWAQERHVVDRSAMKTAVTAKAQADEADRAAVREVVHTPEAQAVADRFGLNLTRVDDAIATMSPDEIHALAGPARTVSSASTPSGGDAIVISTTTLLLLLILIVLIVR
jgi:hypothetical protein